LNLDKGDTSYANWREGSLLAAGLSVAAPEVSVSAKGMRKPSGARRHLSD